ncbi:MAG: Holliday junction branch migration protein RuvA [Desulfitobacteriaceae bacterium]|nr:Holliday junction branch migration protein RuvA [Desulfitobacteriaceae bacterium]MDI6880327.1 Holliday junction branch migration protein RuvA [Desulfitobacteriaceae bacterium]MDI6915682.1 Holliday junction branch migration protein RuvA [Desulfitobacteriaceae bacterium]
MIGMLRGRVWEIQAEKLILDVQGVGYLLSVPLGILSRVHTGQELIVYTHTHMREEEIALYGFASLNEKKLFLDMLNVSGIGPKVGMAILSTLGQPELEQALAQEDIGRLTKVPGVGKKTAQRLVLELKDKFKGLGIEEMGANETYRGDSEALETLLALGFSPEEARKALSRAMAGGEPLPVEEQVRLALKHLAG